MKQNTNKHTLVRVTMNTRNKLKKRKLTKFESYDEIISRLLRKK